MHTHDTQPIVIQIRHVPGKVKKTLKKKKKSKFSAS